MLTVRGKPTVLTDRRQVLRQGVAVFAVMMFSGLAACTDTSKGVDILQTQLPHERLFGITENTLIAMLKDWDRAETLLTAKGFSQPEAGAAKQIVAETLSRLVLAVVNEGASRTGHKMVIPGEGVDNAVFYPDDTPLMTSLVSILEQDPDISPEAVEDIVTDTQFYLQLRRMNIPYEHHGGGTIITYVKGYRQNGVSIVE